MIAVQPSDIEKVRQLLEQKTKQRDIAILLGLSRPRVANIARTLKRARPEWLEWVDRGALTLKHLEYVLNLKPALADELLRRAMQYGWSTDYLRKEVTKAKGVRVLEEPSADPNVADLERRLSSQYQARVSIDTKGAQGGRLVFAFADNDDLDGILERIGYRGE